MVALAQLKPLSHALDPAEYARQVDAPIGRDLRINDQIAFLRRHIAPALDHAAMFWVAENDEADLGDAACALIATCYGLGWPVALAGPALSAEWKAARKRFTDLSAEMEQAVRRLAYESAPGREIISAAKAIQDRRQFIMPDDLTTEFCKRVANATLPRRRHGGR